MKTDGLLCWCGHSLIQHNDGEVCRDADCNCTSFYCTQSLSDSADITCEHCTPHVFDVCASCCQDGEEEAESCWQCGGSQEVEYGHGCGTVIVHEEHCKSGQDG